MSSYCTEAGIVRHHSGRWCGEATTLKLEGRLVLVMCTRFKGHLTHPAAKDPTKHFDQVSKQSWYEPTPQPCDE